MAEGDELFPTDLPEGENNIKMVLDQYALAVEIWDRVHARRQRMDAFYLTINTAIIGGIVGIGTTDRPNLVVMSFLGAAGLQITVLWYFSILSNMFLIESKQQVLHRLEELLPSAPFSLEKLLNERNHPFVTFSARVEHGIPIVFGIFYLWILFYLLSAANVI